VSLVQVRAEAMHFELTQYYATKPGTPRTIKGLAAKVAYHSTDAPAIDPFSISSSSPFASLVRFHLFSVGLSSGTGRRTVLHRSVANIHPEYTRALQGCIELHWTQSADDSHSHTHYEVQRRLLLVNTLAPVALQLPPPSRGVGSPNKQRNNRNNQKVNPPPAIAEAKPFEEAIYIGPWKHVAGLNSAVASKANKSRAVYSSVREVPSIKEASNKLSVASFPHHASSCTDRVGLPGELDGNPDAYNSVMGYLCATFPDMVLRAAEDRDVNHRLAAHVPDGAAPNEIPTEVASSSVPEEALLDRLVESGLSICFEYRVRAVNSVGPGKFNASKAYLPLQQTSALEGDNNKGLQKPLPPPLRKVCLVHLAHVCTHLGQLCDFRAHQPKYLSHNTSLVSGLLQERAEHAQREAYAGAHSGDPFVEYLVGLKDGAEEVDKQEVEREGSQTTTVIAFQGESALGPKNDAIDNWLLSLQNECPL
jgi:hypothetical protein